MSHLIKLRHYTSMIDIEARCSVGPCSVKVEILEGKQWFTMTGPSGTHRLKVSATSLDRLNAHWGGFLYNNGVLEIHP